MASSAFEVRNDREARIGYANVEFRVNAEILYRFSFELRRRRWLISAQGSRNENPGNRHTKGVLTLKGFRNWRTLSGFRRIWIHVPGFSSLEPWAEISQRLRRIFGSSFHHTLLSAVLNLF